jgi:hypothetical protein
MEILMTMCLSKGLVKMKFIIYFYFLNQDILIPQIQKLINIF